MKTIDAVEWLTSRQLSDEWHISVWTMDYWVYEGRGPASEKIGRQRRYRRSGVEAWLESRVSEKRLR